MKFKTTTYLLFLLALLSVHAQAQQVLLSVSGENASMVSGDDRHQYDIWIQPDANAKSGVLEVYDAGMGGSGDVLLNNEDLTTTTFSVYAFDDIYRLTDVQVQPKSSNATPLFELKTTDEERFTDQWVSLTDVESQAGSGYIVRVSTEGGDDVNTFNFRVRSGNKTLTGNSWHIITFDLSIALFESQADQYFQFKRYSTGLSDFSPLSVSGEEDIQLRKIDLFGDLYELNQVDIPINRFGRTNSWGLHIPGSSERKNNLTVFGENSPVLWLFEPYTGTGFGKPSPSIRKIPQASCIEKSFEIAANNQLGPSVNEALWQLDGEVLANGRTPLFSFATKRGDLNLNALIPEPAGYFPDYWYFPQTVTVNIPPISRLTTSKTVISPYEQITLSAEGSYDRDGKPLNYTWFVNGTERGSGIQFTFSDSLSRSSAISVRVSNGGQLANCSNSQKQVMMRVNAQPRAEIEGPDIISTGVEQEYKVINARDADGDSLSFFWEETQFDDNPTGPAVTVVHEQAGNYKLSLRVSDNTNTSNADFLTIKEYTVNASPVAVIQAPEKVAPNQEFQLSSTSSSDSNNPQLSFRWFIDGEEISTDPSFTHQIAEPGIYDIRLVADDMLGLANSVSESTQTIRVNQNPVPVITAPAAISTSFISFSADSSFSVSRDSATFTWDFGDGNTATGPNPSHAYQQAGTYTVTLEINDGQQLPNSLQRTTKEIIVNAFPIARFELPEVIAPGEAIPLDGTPSTDPDGSINQYSWFVNGEPYAEGIQQELTLPEAGIYSITLEVTDDSGFDNARASHSQELLVNTPPVPKWTTSPKILTPDTAIVFSAAKSFDPDGTIASYKWEFEDGSVYEGEEITHTFKKSGTISFNLTVTDETGVANADTTLQTSAEVNYPPYIVTETLVRSNTLKATLDATQSYDLDNDPLSFEWTLPDGSKWNEASFSWEAPETGVHIVALQVDDGQGLPNSISEELIRVIINQPVQAVVDSMIASCTGQTVLFNSSRSYDPDNDPFKVSWDFGDGTTSQQANPSYVYDTPGVFEATLRMNDGFSDEETIAKIPVIIEGSPVARMNISDTTICVNSPLELDGTSSTDPSGSLPALTWDLGDGETKTGPKIRHVFTEAGEYKVALTVEGSGSSRCSNISQVSRTVQVIDGPVASFEIPEWAAPGEQITLDGSESVAEGGFKEAKWLIETVDTTITLQGLNNSYTFEEAGEYFITLDLTTNTTTDCNTVSLTKSIQVNAPPEIVWDLPETVPLGSDLKLNASSSFDPDGYIKEYSWYLNGEKIGKNTSEIIKPSLYGRHSVSLEVTDNSLSTNKRVSEQKYFVVTGGPNPVIAPFEIPYITENIQLQSLSFEDKEGNPVTSNWYLDGTPIAEPRFTLDEMKTYRVVLIQDNDKGNENSVDSAVVLITPKMPPPAKPVYPRVVVENSSLNINDIDAFEGWLFEQNGQLSQRWIADKPGTDSLVLAWVNNNRIITRESHPITIVETLRFTEQTSNIEADWNPVHPTITIKAIPVNRSVSQVQHLWKKDGEVIGKGIQLETTLDPGTHTLVLEVHDLGISNSKPIRTELTVTVE